MYTVRHVLRHVVVSFTTLAQISRLFEKNQTHIDKTRKRYLKLMLKRFLLKPISEALYRHQCKQDRKKGLKENTAFQYTALIVN